MSEPKCDSSKSRRRLPQIFSGVFVLRAVVIAILLVAAGICGAFTALYINTNEQELADARYNLIARHGLSELVDRFNVRYNGMVMFSKMVSYYHSDPQAWPNVTVPGFYDTVPELQRMTALDNVSFLPIVKPEQLSSFEEFMYEYFDSEPALPPNAGIHHFGKGVFAIDPNNPNTTYHDITGKPILYKSKNAILTPSLQVILWNTSDASRVAFNVHSHPQFGPAMDAIIDECSPRLDYVDAVQHCGWLSDSQPLPSQTEQNPHPAITNYRSSIIQPVYLNQNSSRLVGFVSGGINWGSILSQSFEGRGMRDLDCVMSDGKVTFTYTKQDDEIVFVGTGDYHDHEYDSYEQSTVLAADSLAFNKTIPFTVRVYPTRQFLEQYMTNTGIYAGVGVALMFVLLAVVFLLNDVLLRREGRRKSKILDTKRRFVRFVSHEIRTPLNSVHLGLELLAAENDLQGRLTAEPSSQEIKRWDDTPHIDGTLPDILGALHSWQELAADMMGNSESAVDVLNDLLNYDKIEMGTLRLDFSAVAIYPLVEKCTNAFQMQAKQKSVNLVLIDPPVHERNEYRRLIVIGDHSRIAQVLRNLLSNALKFTPEGGNIQVQVTWTLAGLPSAPLPTLANNALQDPRKWSRAGSVQISVTDSGVGLTPEQLSQICSEGVQFNANQLQAGQGSGLGLFISKGLATQHGGSLTVTSEGLGKGATFTLELPVLLTRRGTLAEEAPEVAPPRSALFPAPSSDTSGGSALPFAELAEAVSQSKQFGAAQDTTPDAKSHSVLALESSSQLKRVLVVDDAATNRKMLIRLLKARGYVCEQAEDGQRGIELYQALCERREAVDVIVMDYEMPVMDGPTATKKLREVGCACLIVGVTGNLLPEDVNYFKSQGANAVLSKPLNMKVFEELLEGHHAIEAKARKMDKSRSKEDVSNGRGGIELV